MPGESKKRGGEGGGGGEGWENRLEQCEKGAELPRNDGSAHRWE